MSVADPCAVSDPTERSGSLHLTLKSSDIIKELKWSTIYYDSRKLLCLFIDLSAMSLQLSLGTLFGFLAGVGVWKGLGCVSTILERAQDVLTVQSGLITADNAVDLLAGFVGGVTSGGGLVPVH